MSYIETKNRSVALQSAIIPATELDRILDEYHTALAQAKEAVRKTAELIRINDERDRLFVAMKESFDILFEEVETLKAELTEKNTLIERLNKEIKRLKTLKNVRKRLKQRTSADLAVDLDEEV